MGNDGFPIGLTAIVIAIIAGVFFIAGLIIFLVLLAGL